MIGSWAFSHTTIALSLEISKASELLHEAGVVHDCREPDWRLCPLEP